MIDFLKMALAHIPQYFLDLFEVASAPKTFVAKLDCDAPETTQKASIFYGLTALFAALLQAPLNPQRQGAPDFIVDVTVNLVILILTMLGLRLAWKAVGGTANFKQLFIVTSYTVAPGLLIFLCMWLAGMGFIRIGDPEWAAYMMNPSFRVEAPREQLDSPAVTTGNALLSMAVAWLLTWSFITWGAYRRINQVGRVRSFLAAIVSLILTVPAVAFVVGLAQLFVKD